MTLKEKFIDAFKSGKRFDIQNAEKIADDYAIEFANWCVEKELFNTIRYERITTKQLLEIFKKQKGL
jgi:hypothetical protein